MDVPISGLATHMPSCRTQLVVKIVASNSINIYLLNNGLSFQYEDPSDSLNRGRQQMPAWMSPKRLHILHTINFPRDMLYLQDWIRGGTGAHAAQSEVERGSTDPEDFPLGPAWGF
jgi:hypothetical protein